MTWVVRMNEWMISWGERGLCNSYGRFIFGSDFLDTHEIIETLFDVLKKGFLNAWRFKFRKESNNFHSCFKFSFTWPSSFFVLSISSQNGRSLISL